MILDRCIRHQDCSHNRMCIKGACVGKCISIEISAEHSSFLIQIAGQTKQLCFYSKNHVIAKISLTLTDMEIAKPQKQGGILVKYSAPAGFQQVVMYNYHLDVPI